MLATLLIPSKVTATVLGYDVVKTRNNIKIYKILISQSHPTSRADPLTGRTAIWGTFPGGEDNASRSNCLRNSFANQIGGAILLQYIYD